MKGTEIVLDNTLDLDFLPFSMETRKCYVLFTNVISGLQFTVSVNVNILNPEVDSLQLENVISHENSDFLTSHEAYNTFNLYKNVTVEHRDENLELAKKSIIFKKETDAEPANTNSSTTNVASSKLVIVLPKINYPMENALKHAAQKYMTEKEIHRRTLTKTINSGIVAGNTIKSIFERAMKNQGFYDLE